MATIILCDNVAIIVMMLIAADHHHHHQGEKKREEKAARGHPAATTNKIASHTNAFLTSNQVPIVTTSLLLIFKQKIIIEQYQRTI